MNSFQYTANIIEPTFSDIATAIEKLRTGTWSALDYIIRIDSWLNSHDSPACIEAKNKLDSMSQHVDDEMACILFKTWVKAKVGTEQQIAEAIKVEREHKHGNGDHAHWLDEHCPACYEAERIARGDA